MSLIFKSYDPERYQRRAERRRQKLSLEHSKNGVQDDTSQSSHQDERCKDDQLRQELVTANTTMPPTPESNTNRKVYSVDASGTPTSTTIDCEASNTRASSAELAWPTDAKITSSSASSINTPASATPSVYGQETFPRRSQGSSVNSKARTPLADLSLLDATSEDALSGLSFPVSECQKNIARELQSSDQDDVLANRDVRALHALASATSIVEKSDTRPNVLPSITESISDEKTPALHASATSVKRPFSDGDATSHNKLAISDVYQPAKRVKVTSVSPNEAVSTLLDIQKMVSNVLAKMNQDQSYDPISDVDVQTVHDTIEVNTDEPSDENDDVSNASSSFNDRDSDTGLKTSQSQGFQHRSTQRRRWTRAEEMLLSRLKNTQKRNGILSDYEIAGRLDRTESGVKQHWDIMEKAQRYR
ncbi:hypothetical protein NW762_012833 [Fusarium torreyae]|uniref:Myb-like domain-containing protein n=1 Tax=Fusarium torreyae TaxID=1237075 RepID=A0A9W8VAY6_9HYPO|nr:hypothetical protein NW762_012833 [Fusarium torreyae]